MISISWWVSSGGKSCTQWIPTSSTDNLDSTISSMMTSLLIFSVAVLYAFPDSLIVSSVVYSSRTISFEFFKPNLSLPVALRFLLKDNGYSIMLQFTKQFILQSIKKTLRINANVVLYTFWKRSAYKPKLLIYLKI